MRWSSQSLGSKSQHQFFYFLLRHNLLGLASFILNLVVLYYVLNPKVRRRARPYLKRRFPLATSFEYLEHTYRLYKNFATVLLTRAQYGLTRKIQTIADARAQEALNTALAEDKGCLILGAHVGAWQIALLGLEKSKRPIKIVQFRPGDLDKHYFEHDEKLKHEIKLIDPTDQLGTALSIAQALAKKEIVCLMGDRLSKENSFATVNFLDSPIKIPLSAYQIAAAAQVPILVTMTTFKQGKIKVEIAEVWHVPYEAKDDPKLLQSFAEKYILLLEKFVSSHPYNFFNFYDMWECDE